jgi:hypothetical protein
VRTRVCRVRCADQNSGLHLALSWSAQRTLQLSIPHVTFGTGLRLMGDGSTMAESERDLVRQLQGGERAALEALYRRYVERVWRYAFARTRDREVAADVVQDTFLRVWQRIGTFRGRAQFSTWLFAVARSALVDEVRRRRRASGADASRLDPRDPACAAFGGDGRCAGGAAAVSRRWFGLGRLLSRWRRSATRFGRRSAGCGLLIAKWSCFASCAG